MLFNGKDIPFPSIPRISFFKVIEKLEVMSTDDDTSVAAYATSLLKEAEKYPELRDGFEDSALLEKYKEPIAKLSRMLFPDVLTSNEIKALTPPFEFKPFYTSKRFGNILDSTDQDFSFYLKDMSSDEFYMQSCYFILASYYGYPIQTSGAMMIELEDKKQNIQRTYRLAINGELIEFIPTEKAVDISKEDFEELLDNYDNIELWKEKFPPNSWIMRGLLMINMMDITIDQSLSNITSNLLHKSADSFVNIKKGLRSLFSNNSLESGLVVFKENELSPVYKNDVSSILLDEEVSLNCNAHMSSETFKHLMVRKKPLVVPDVDSFCDNNPNPISELLKKTCWKSYIMAPLVHEDELLGFIELASEKKYELNTVSLIKLNHVLPVLAMATKRYRTEAQNRIEAIIQQECTTVHPSVKWRFEQEAQQFMVDQYSGEQAVFNDIIFKEVYPLYGQMDIKSSSTIRNEAVKKDLIKQINGVRKILTAAQEITNMPVYEELLFRVESYKAEISKGLAAGSEHQILEFFKSEIYPVFAHLKSDDPELAKLVNRYDRKLDPELHSIYEERRKYDSSVNLINQKLASYLDHQQAEAQQMFPHYFERYKTDGVEYNIYIGQSISRQENFSEIHLQNLRLWQLKVMVEMENEFKLIQQELEVPVEVASLILAHSTPLAVHFRMDEKRFDVEGAYNARYEIIKKRIDKAHIKGTKERITQPGKIAIVYSTEQDAMEYRKYLSFLSAKGFVKPKIEDYELEHLQGINGLRALRAEVEYHLPNQDEGVDVDELIKSIEEN